MMNEIFHDMSDVCVVYIWDDPKANKQKNRRGSVVP